LSREAVLPVITAPPQRENLETISLHPFNATNAITPTGGLPSISDIHQEIIQETIDPASVAGIAIRATVKRQPGQRQASNPTAPAVTRMITNQVLIKNRKIRTGSTPSVNCGIVPDPAMFLTITELSKKGETVNIGPVTVGSIDPDFF